MPVVSGSSKKMPVTCRQAANRHRGFAGIDSPCVSIVEIRAELQASIYYFFTEGAMIKKI
jgi:hypothetical protein